MGTGLAMMAWRCGRVLAGAALMLLAACGNDPAGLDRGALLASVARGAGLALPGQANPAAAPLARPEQVLAATQAPVIRAQTAQGDALYMIGVQDNGPYRSYATATSQTVTLRGGLITATRGLGRDLMRADVVQVLDRLTRGSAGAAQRSMEVLDGEDVTRTLLFDCDIAHGAPGLEPRPAQAARLMQESCRGANDDAAGLAFTNSYAMGDGGRILMSRQWLPVSSGAMLLEELRP